MVTQVSERRITPLYRYLLASADMYYCEVNQRDVCVGDAPRTGLHIWGEIPGGGPVTAVNLCQVFLEYAMYCQTWRDSSKAYQNMQAFGERLGKALARYIQDSVPAEMAVNPSAYALQYVLESMNAHFTIGQVGPELRFSLADCPLLETARCTGLMEVELAHHGIRSLCQSLIHFIDPDLVVCAPPEARVAHIFSVIKPPVCA
ncbi:MAG TPA: hypothetical protein VJG32_09390 [Anaerolineae bacterium]|nr:hypothetical protein [Anaerolineae bacterium]